MLVKVGNVYVNPSCVKLVRVVEKDGKYVLVVELQSRNFEAYFEEFDDLGALQERLRKLSGEKVKIEKEVRA